MMKQNALNMSVNTIILLKVKNIHKNNVLVVVFGLMMTHGLLLAAISANNHVMKILIIASAIKLLLKKATNVRVSVEEENSFTQRNMLMIL